jgi:ribosomal protein L40E
MKAGPNGPTSDLTAEKLAEAGHVIEAAEAKQVSMKDLAPQGFVRHRRCEACDGILPPTEAYFCRKCFFTLPANLRIKFHRFWKINSKKPELLKPMIAKLVAWLKENK